MRKKFLVILSLFIAMILCFTAPAVALADTVVVNPGGGNVTVIVPTNPGDGSSTIVTVTEDEPVIGDMVSFAEHEWYVIGTDSEGVIAPKGCYTLFAKNNDFGSSAFRAGAAGETNNPTAANYKDSDLQTAMENISNGFSSAEIANIVPRATLDDIKGDAVTDQLFWPIGNNEMNNMYDAVKQFDAIYWGRSGFFGSTATDVFIPPEDSTRSLSTRSSSTRSTTPEAADPKKFSVYAYNQDGSERWEAYAGVLGTWASTANYVFAVRPAAYVKTDAVEKIETKEYKAVIGSQIQFAGYHWYIVGMGDAGPVPGPANTVTLFAASSIKDETGECINSYTDTNYADGELSTVMKGLSDTLGLSAREKALITDRTLTTADGISGNSVTTPFWPLSIDEYEAIYEYDPSFLTDTPGWYYWLRTEYGAYSCIYSVNTKNGSTTTIYGNTNSFWVRPACYLDLSDLFFASGDSGMGASVGALPSKLEAPLYGSLQNYNFVMHDDTLSLSMIGAAKQRGSSLTFHYDAVQGEKHYLSYLVERASEPGIPVYYGQAVNLSNSGSGTVTVPLTDDGNMRTGIPLVNGEYILRFYTEDRSQDSVIFAGDTVDLDIRVEDNLVYINDLKDVSPATMVGSMGIDPGQADVEAGKQFQFSAFISPFTETGWFDPVLIWDVTGASSYGTSISQDGLLTVALNETSTELRVTVTSRQDYEIQCVSLVTVTPHVHVGTLVAGTPATCTESGTKDYYTCVCGKCFEDADCTTEITDFDTWKIISPLGHDFVWTSNGDGTHTGVCQHDGCEETVTDNCSGGEATCAHLAVCERCGESYGELVAHTYDKQVATEGYLATAATCTAPAKYYYSCKCGAKGTETFEYGETIAHTYDKQVATEEYLATAATCTKPATYYYSCECGAKGTETFEHGELAEHTAVEIPAVAATCTQAGSTAGSKCSVCGEILVAPEEIAPLGHVDENGDELCDRCGFDMSLPEFTITVTGGTIEGATGTTTTVEENGSVTVVAGEAPEGKEFKGWSIDGGETIISAEAAYTFTASEDMVLTAVFADKQSDVKPGDEITPEGLSGGAIAGIVIGSVFGALVIAYGVCALLYKKKIVKGAFFAKIYPFVK